MTGNTFTAIASPEIGRQLSAALAGIAADIADRRLPKLAAVVLGGGYGRGEGGVRRTPAGDRLCNDLDFFVFSDGANRREAARIDKAMRMIARSWSKELQVAIDFGPVKNLHALQSVAHRLMFQELLRGRRTVWGEAPLERLIPARPAEALPFSEAARLLLNRGMGLWQAGVALRDLLRAPDFILRNIYKAFLGGGDAMLLAAGRYRWKIEARRENFAQLVRQRGMPPEYILFYENACRYKFMPTTDQLVAPWRKWHVCRAFLLEAFRQTAGTKQSSSIAAVLRGLSRSGARERSLLHLARWSLRARRGRPLSMACDDPVITLAGMFYREFAECGEFRAPSGRLLRLWRTIN